MQKGPVARVAPIAPSIVVIRERRVLLDRDLAAIYGVETRTLNQAAKRNATRFPEDFRFRLTRDEVVLLRSQAVILDRGPGQHAKYLPYAFTEHGAIMAATILNSSYRSETGEPRRYDLPDAVGDPQADDLSRTETPRHRVYG
jgi:hypothetical protein